MTVPTIPEQDSSLVSEEFPTTRRNHETSRANVKGDHEDGDGSDKAHQFSLAPPDDGGVDSINHAHDPNMEARKTDEAHGEAGQDANDAGADEAKDASIQQHNSVPIRILDSSANRTHDISNTTGGAPPSQISGQLTMMRGGTYRSFQTKKPAKAAEKVKLSSYEICLQKYTNYLRSKKLDRCEMLMKQGSMIFKKTELLQQFSFN